MEYDLNYILLFLLCLSLIMSALGCLIWGWGMILTGKRKKQWLVLERRT